MPNLAQISPNADGLCRAFGIMTHDKFCAVLNAHKEKNYRRRLFHDGQTFGGKKRQGRANSLEDIGRYCKAEKPIDLYACSRLEGGINIEYF